MINRIVQKLRKANDYAPIDKNNNQKKQICEETTEKQVKQGYSFDDTARYESLTEGKVDIYNYQNIEMMTKDEKIAMEHKILLANPEGEYGI